MGEDKSSEVVSGNYVDSEGPKLGTLDLGAATALLVWITLKQKDIVIKTVF